MNDVKDYDTRRTAVGERQRPSMCAISDVLARALATESHAERELRNKFKRITRRAKVVRS
jgi:hypothetical protein